MGWPGRASNEDGINGGWLRDWWRCLLWAGFRAGGCAAGSGSSGSASGVSRWLGGRGGGTTSRPAGLVRDQASLSSRSFFPVVIVV